MKRIILIALGIVSLQCTAQTGARLKTVPDEVITNDSTAWTISTLSSVSYVNNTPGPYYNTFKSGGGMLVKFNFKKNGRFSFMLYVQANTYGTDTETWTQVEGTVEFKKDAKGQDIFVTRAEKGTYRVTKNGLTSSRPIPKDELAGQHSQIFLWQKTLGGTRIEAAHGIACRADGSIIVGAYSESPDGDMGGTRGLSDIWLLKLTAGGDITWKKSFGGSNTEYTYAFAVLPGGGYVATGYTVSNDGDMAGYKDHGDVFVLRIDEAGNKVWMKTLGGMNTDIGQAISSTPDNGILVAGTTSSSEGDMPGGKGENDLFVVKVDANGKLLWQKTAGSSSIDEAYGITGTGNNSCIIAARSFGNDKDVTGNHHEGSADAWIVKLEK